MQHLLDHCDVLQAEITANQAAAMAFAARYPLPPFQVIHADMWHIPHPHEQHPVDRFRLVAASIGAGIVFGGLFVLAWWRV